MLFEKTKLLDIRPDNFSRVRLSIQQYWLFQYPLSGRMSGTTLLKNLLLSSAFKSIPPLSGAESLGGSQTNNSHKHEVPKGILTLKGFRSEQQSDAKGIFSWIGLYSELLQDAYMEFIQNTSRCQMKIFPKGLIQSNK